MAEPFNINFFPGKGFQANAEQFIAAYELVNCYFPDKDNRSMLVKKSERVCRFCGNAYPVGKFKKIAHLVPELLGNKIWFSDFECDDCNLFFGLKYDNDLAAFMGISRSLTGVKVKGKKPGFRSGPIEVEHISPEPDSGVIIKRENTDNTAIICDAKKGEIKIRFKRGVYSPVNVYKSLLKIALSILPHDQVKDNYAMALQWLLNRNDKILKGCLLHTYILPFHNKQPMHVLLFKKRDSKNPIHTHVINIYAQNFIFSFPIPLHKDDLKFYTGQSLSIPICPPLFVSKQMADNIIVQQFSEDMSSSEKVKDREDEITLQMHAEDLKKSAALDLETGIIENKEFDPSEIVKVIVRPRNKPADIDELKRYISI